MPSPGRGAVIGRFQLMAGGDYVSSFVTGTRTMWGWLIEAKGWLEKEFLTHPGDILREELKTRGLSANQFALDLAVPSGRIVEILNCKRGVSADTALRLSRYFGTSAQVWMNIQAQYDLERAQQKVGAKIARSVKPGSDAATSNTTQRKKLPGEKRRRAAG
jgi:antitoxin HigA-1